MDLYLVCLRVSFIDKKKKIIFEGTVVDCGCMLPAFVFQGLFESEGVEATLAEARAPMGMHKRVSRALLAWSGWINYYFH